MATAHSTLTGAELHEPKGASAASTNQTYVSNGAGSGVWSEPEPKGAIAASAEQVYVANGAASGAWTSQKYVLSGTIADISTAGDLYIPIPYAGNVVKVTGVLHGAIGTANATITVFDNGGNSMGAITVAFSGSAAGDVDTLAPASNQDVTADDWIRVTNNDASTNTVSWSFSIVVERT